MRHHHITVCTCDGTRVDEQHHHLHVRTNLFLCVCPVDSTKNALISQRIFGTNGTFKEPLDVRDKDQSVRIVLSSRID